MSQKKTASSNSKVPANTKKTTNKKKTSTKGKASVKKTSNTSTKAGKSPKSKEKSRKVKSASRSKTKKTNGRKIVVWVKLLSILIVLFGLFLIYTDANVRSKFEGKRWSVPAKVYARPMELYPGQPIQLKELKAELARLNYRRNRTGVGSFQDKGQDSLSINTRGFQFWDGIESAKNIVVHLEGDRVQKILEQRNNSYSSLPLVRLEPVLIGGIYPKHNEDRELVRLSQVPEELINTLIAVEDRDFAKHNGISVKGIMRALLVNVGSGQIKQGGSTLTQQLVKNFYLTNKRSITRKALEAVMALLLELHYSKEEILEAYLNEVYLGQAGDKAIHGFGLASQFYFGQSLAELKLHQTALLVGLVKGPSYYDPRRHPQRAIERRNQVIDVLTELGEITANQSASVKQTPLDIVEKAQAHLKTFPAFMDLLKRQLRRDYREEDLNSEGLRIFTTLNPSIQQHSEKAVQQVISQLQQSGYGLDGELEGALVVSEPESGELLALVGGKNPRYAGFNRALDAIRPIGSVIKPAVYLAALEKGHHFGEIIQDEPVEVKTNNGQMWRPQNFDKKFHGEIILQEGLIHSYNLATTRLGLDVGVEPVIDVLRRGGVDRPLASVPSLFLGAVELSPLDVTAFYQTIAANGFTTQLKTIREVTTSDGQPVARYPLQVKQVFHPSDVYMLTRVMQMAVARGTGKQIYQRLDPGLQLAGKTGTTDNQRDSWFVGLSGNYLAVSWVGRDDNGVTQLTGATGAMAVWTELMASIQPEPLNPLQPEDVLDVWIDPSSGKLSAKHCDNAVIVPLRISSLPQEKSACVEGGGWRRWFKRS